MCDTNNAPNLDIYTLLRAFAAKNELHQTFMSTLNEHKMAEYATSANAVKLKLTLQSYRDAAVHQHAKPYLAAEYGIISATERTRGWTDVANAELDSSDAFTACARSHLTSAKNLANILGNLILNLQAQSLQCDLNTTDTHFATAPGH